LHCNRKERDAVGASPREASPSRWRRTSQRGGFKVKEVNNLKLSWRNSKKE
jgi:hypothetical protein